MVISALISTVSYIAIGVIFGAIGLNAQQKYRPALTTCLVVFLVFAFRNITDANLGFNGTDTIAMYILFVISHMINALCIEKYVLPKKPGVSFDWRGAYKILFNGRWVGTYRQAPNIQNIAEREKYHEPPQEWTEVYPTYPMTDLRAFVRSPRFRFLRNRVISLATLYAIDQFYHLLYEAVLPKYADPVSFYDMLPSKQTYFRRLATVTLRETVIRIWMVCYWVWYSYSLYTALHHFFSFVFVAVGLDNHHEYPTLFGNISEASSVRGFWGKFWHRGAYRGYTAYGKLISTKILGLPRNGLAGQLFVNGFVFLLSGVLHAITLRQLGFTCGAMSEIRFYCEQYLAILGETAVQAAFKRLTRGHNVNGIITKTVGYIWVFGFLFYSVPKKNSLLNRAESELEKPLSSFGKQF